MTLARQQAVVLQVRPYGDHDAVVPMFAAQHGRVTCFFRGLRKTKKRDQLTLRPGFVLSLELERRPGSDLYIAQALDVLDTNLALSNDLGRLLALNLVVEAYRDAFAEGQNDENAFGLLTATLSALHNTPAHDVVRSFCNELLELLGYGETIHTSSASDLRFLQMQLERVVGRELSAFRFFLETMA